MSSGIHGAARRSYSVGPRCFFGGPYGESPGRIVGEGATRRFIFGERGSRRSLSSGRALRADPLGSAYGMRICRQPAAICVIFLPMKTKKLTEVLERAEPLPAGSSYPSSPSSTSSINPCSSARASDLASASSHALAISLAVASSSSSRWRSRCPLLPPVPELAGDPRRQGRSPSRNVGAKLRPGETSGAFSLVRIPGNRTFQAAQEHTGAGGLQCSA
jgi:hypothetical protein